MHRGQAGDGVRTRSRKRGQQRAGLHQGKETRKRGAKRPGKHGAELRDQVKMGWS